MEHGERTEFEPAAFGRLLEHLRERVYGMPHAECKARHQTGAAS